MHRMTIIGRLGQDPEMRFTPSGVTVTSFSVASENKSKGEAQTEWIKVSVFGALADTCNQYLSKGKQVFVEGVFKSRSYENKSGETKFSLEMIGSTVQFLSPVGEAKEVMEGDLDGDGDLPF